MNKTAEAAARVAIVGVVSSIALWYVFLADPVEYLNAEVVTPVVTAGERVSVIYTLDKRRSCRTEINQFIISERTGEAVWRAAAPGGYGGRGVSTVRVSIPTLPEWDAGTYVYRPSVFYECGPFTIQGTIPAARFEVRKRPTAG